MQPSDFVHLRCHSTYSLLEALSFPEEVVLRAKELGQSAVGLTDKGHVYGLIEFYRAALDLGVKPLLGCEVSVAARTRLDRDPAVDAKHFPLTLLAETNEGYQNLLALCTKAALEGMYYKPRVDDELLRAYGRGVIALSGPLGGAIPQAALREDGARLTQLVGQYRSFFGERNVYFELMDLPHLSGQAEVNQQLVRWGKELGVPLVATCPSHYCRPEDREAHDVLLCIQRNERVTDPGRFSMLAGDYSMRPFAELEAAFSHVPAALENTRLIADRCSVSLSFGEYKIPRFPVGAGEQEEILLRRLCVEGLLRRYPGLGGGASGEDLLARDARLSPADRAIVDRLTYELGVIERMGFAGYFLIVWDFIRFAKEQGIMVGPGRGSVTGSLVSYCLDITTLDPLKHGLLFERFLNPERVSMPDIDLDFADTRRDEVLAYVGQKYGRDHVTQICTFGTLAARAAVKDVGRAYGVPFTEMNELAKLISERPGTELRPSLERSGELRVAYNSQEIYRKIIDTALKIEGKARHVSVHACGVIITPEPSVHYTALQRAPKDDETVITQYEAKSLEALGLLKMDFLGLKNLTILQTTLSIVERVRGETIDLAQLPLEDDATFALLSRGETTGVFQLESAGMRRYLKDLKPTRFEDIVAMVALFRPGPMEWIPRYVQAKHGERKVEYLHPSLEPCLGETYGIAVYQEQVMQIAQHFAGMKLGDAYSLLKGIAKKIPEVVREHKHAFIAGARARGHAEALALQIFEKVVEPFAGYGFNKAHAAGYALIAYQTAYLKAHEPTAFMAALLSSDAGDTERIALEIDECRAMGIRVLPPDVNESLSLFTVVPDPESDRRHIRFGLTAIKGVGESTVGKIIAMREQGGKFHSLEDFAARMPVRLLNKKVLEALAKAGALDSLGERGTLVAHYNLISDYSRAAGDRQGDQDDLFTGVSGELGETPIAFPATEPASLFQKLHWEKETMGLYISSHPLAGLRKYISRKANLVADLTRDQMGRKVTIAGIEESLKKIMTKKGEAMAVLELQDPTGRIEVTLFPKVLAQAVELFGQPDTVLVVGGALGERGGRLHLRADAVKKASLTAMVKRAKEEGFFDSAEAERGLLAVARGTLPVEHASVVDEEGNVVELAAPEANGATAHTLVGPLTAWIVEGMPIDPVLHELGASHGLHSSASSSDPTPPITSLPSPSAPQISLHTIRFPERASKQLLLELKGLFERFPGKERVQLAIGSQLLALPLSISMSTILEKKIDDLLAKYAVKE